MSGSYIDASELEGITELRQVIAQVQNFDRQRLMEALAFTTENQVRRRISVEKVGPNGPWPRWSRKYAVTRLGKGGSLLQRSNALLDSITSYATDDEAAAGTNKVYAASHQFGDNEPVSIGMHIRNISQAFGRQLKQKRRVVVKAHTVKRNIPARTFLWWSTANVNELRDVAIDFLERTAIKK